MRVVIIGGGAAGMSTASRIKRLKPEYEVVVIERTSHVSHAPCGVPYYIEGFCKNLGDLTYYPPEYFREKRGIDVRTETSAVEIEQGRIFVESGGKEESIEWDSLVIATGARPRIPDIEGKDLEGVFTIDSIDDGFRIKRELAKHRRVVIVGAGYIETGLIEALIALNKEVTVIEKEPQVLPQVDPEVAKVLEREISEHAEVRTGEEVVAIEGRERVEKIVTDRNEYHTEMVILATGVEPNVELARDLGVKLGETGAIFTDSRMRTNVENVYAAGDCAETVHMVSGKRVWIPLAPAANRMGYVAGANIAGADLKFPGVAGTALTKFFDLQIGKTGLNEREAKLHGFDPVSAIIETKTRPRYYPGGKEIMVKLIADRSGLLLGTQIVGYEGVPGRVRTISAFLQKKATVEDLFFADLAYFPQFGPVWDPLIISSRQLLKKL